MYLLSMNKCVLFVRNIVRWHPERYFVDFSMSVKGSQCVVIFQLDHCQQ